MFLRLAGFFQKAHDFIRRHCLSTFRSTVLSFFIPVIMAFILVTGMISYLLATRQAEESARHEVENLVHQTCQYTDSRLQSVLEQLTALSGDPVILEALQHNREDMKPQYYLSVQSHVDTVRLYNSSIIDTVYINLNHGSFKFFRGDSDYCSLTDQYGDISHFQKEKEAEGNISWYVRDEGEQDGKTVHSVDVVKRIGGDTSEKEGILVLRLREEFFRGVLTQKLLNGNGYLTVVDTEGHEVLGDMPQEYRPDQETDLLIRTNDIPHGFIEFQSRTGEKMIAIYDTLETNQWKLVGIFPQDTLLGKIVYIKYLTFVAVLILMVLALLLTNALTGYVMRPISELVDRMARMRKQEITAATPGAPHTLTRKGPVSEVEVLGHGVDDLMGHVTELMEQVKKDQELQRELELSVVQMQVHPHFLYNTLFAIKGLCDMGLNEDASRMILALANFFRIGLSHGREILPVSQEVDHARNYLYIQEMRYGDVFTYQFDVDPDTGQYSIIKLTLQPLVENAIYHGVKEKRGQGLIKVRGWEEAGMLHFTVEDDGMGMKPERLAELRKGLAETRLGRKHIGFGVFSVFERLRLHYGEEAGLEIKSEYGVGTCIHVVLPARKMEESQDAQDHDRG